MYITSPLKILPISPAMRANRLSVPDGITYSATTHTAIPIMTEHIIFLPTDSAIPDSFKGIDLTELILYDRRKNNYIFAVSEYKPYQKAGIFNKKIRISCMRDRNWKLILEEEFEDAKIKEKYELYKISEDALEEKNLAIYEKDLLIRYKEILKECLSRDN